MDVNSYNGNVALHSFPGSNVTWYIIENGNLWAADPNNERIRWHVVKRDKGWVWYIVSYNPHAKLSSEFGPFSNPAAAQADCEVAHRPEKESTDEHH